MRLLENKELSYVGGMGGGEPKLVCNNTENATKSSTGGITVTTSSTCQSSSGLTFITTTVTDYTEVGFGASRLGKLLGISANVEVSGQKTTTIVCKPDGSCQKIAGDNFGGGIVGGSGGMLLPDDEPTMMS